MKRVGASVAMLVVALTLVTPPAAAQNGSAWLTPKPAESREAAGEVVLTVSMWRAGRVAYQTFDGACEVDFLSAGSPPATCSDYKKARAPEDYAATSGELVFTEGGSKTIRIPIIDDDVADGDKRFTVAAWEEANADPWIDRGDSATVYIIDDEVDPSGGNSAAPAGGSSTNTGPAGGQSSGSAVGAPAPKAPGAGGTADPATTTTAAPRSPGLQMALPDGEFRPGPGFELTSEGAPETAAQRRGGGGGSASGLVIGSGTAALGVGALAVVRRRRRWSPTQA